MRSAGAHGQGGDDGRVGVFHYHRDLDGLSRDGSEGVHVSGGAFHGGGEPFGGYPYMGSLYILAPANLSPLAEKLHEVLAESGALASASVSSGGLCAVRVLSEKARELYRR